jgi:hypothetical protein
MITPEQIIVRYENAPLECDGMTRVLFSEFTRAGIAAEVYGGILEWRGSIVRPHYWIILPASGRLVDLRAHMWLGDDPAIPHGVFLPEQFPDAKYQGVRADWGTLHPTVVEMMCRPLPLAVIDQVEQLRRENANREGSD